MIGCPSSVALPIPSSIASMAGTRRMYGAFFERRLYRVSKIIAAKNISPDIFPEAIGYNSKTNVFTS
jgi:hypothetical protein